MVLMPMVQLSSGFTAYSKLQCEDEKIWNGLLSSSKELSEKTLRNASAVRCAGGGKGEAVLELPRLEKSRDREGTEEESSKRGAGRVGNTRRA